MDITKLTIEQLKAAAYDCVLELTRLQNVLQALNAELAKRTQGEPKMDEKEEENGTAKA